MADTEGTVQQEAEKQGIHSLCTVAYATFHLYATCSAKCVRSLISFWLDVTLVYAQGYYTVRRTLPPLP